MKLLILKGLHNSIPPIFRTSSSECFMWEYQFTLDSTYDLKSEDQKDWNKLIGLKTNYFKPMENSVMVGFRYNVEEKVYELNLYTHENNLREMSDPVLKVLPGEKFTVGFNRSSIGTVGVVIRVGDRVYITFHPLPHKRVFLINTWFGGNNPSPVNFLLSIKKLF